MASDRVYRVFLASLTTGLWQANCYVVAGAGLDTCVIIDPGQDSAAKVRAVLTENRLEPRAILLTHGHFDHVADAATLGDEFNIPTYIHRADRQLLSDPAAGLSAEGVAVIRAAIVGGLAEPARVEAYNPAKTLNVAGLTFTVIEAPGHTAGSVLLGIDYGGHPTIRRLIFSGDVVFAGSVGRTDLPGGNPAQMATTLTEVVLDLSDSTALLPGHGDQTTMAEQRVHNPYLQPGFLRN